MGSLIRTAKYNFLWIFIVCLHLVLLLKTTFFPYPELFVYPYLTKIGLLPYRQIFDQHFPGLMFFPLNFATLGIVTPQSIRIVELALIVITHLGLLKIGKVKGLSKGYLAGIALLYLCWQGYFEGGTFWIESLLVPILVWVYYFLTKFSEKRTTDYIYAGLLLGTALVTKQIVVPLAGVLSLFLLYRHKNKEIWYFLLFAAIPVILMLAFVFARGIEKDFFYWAGTFNFTAYHDMGRKYPTVKEIVSTLFFALPALGGLTILIHDKKTRNEGFLLAIFFLTGFLYAYARFDYVHLQPIIPFGILLFVFGALNHRYRKVVILLFLLFSLVIGARSYIRNWGNETKFFGVSDYAVFHVVSMYAPPGSSVFAFGTYPYIYPMTNTHPAGNVFVFQFPWFMKIAEEPILRGLMSDPPVVVIRDTTAMTDTYNLVTYMPKITQFVDRYYKVTEKIGSTEILTKR